MAIADPAAIPPQVMSYLRRRRIVPEFLTEQHLPFLEKLAEIWGDFSLIADQLSPHGYGLDG